MGRAGRWYCRYVAVVFAGITAYTVVTKSLDGRLAGDWLHSVLHVASAAVAAYAGWAARRDLPSVVFTVLLATLYLGLGVLGWFVDGFFEGTPMAIPLGPADNVFHLLLGVAAVAVLVTTRLPAAARNRSRSA